jgi:hypothetical protein
MHALPRQAAAVKMKSENIQSKLSTRDFFFCQNKFYFSSNCFNSCRKTLLGMQKLLGIRNLS